MGLVEVQRALAQLYTNKELREKFLSNPQEIALEFGLTDIDIEHLTALSVNQLQEFADSLQYKRLGEVSKILVLTEKSLEKNFEKLFLEFTNNYLPSGIKKHRDDALAFAKFISNGSHKNVPVWCQEIAAFEAIRLQLTDTNKFFISKIFHYSIKEIIVSLNENKEVMPKKKKLLGTWIRIPGWAQWHFFLIPILSI